MVKRLGLWVGVVALLIGTSVRPVEAAPITGGISIFGGFIPVNGLTGAPSTLLTATGIDFTNLFSALGSPGTPGQFLVNGSSGSLSVIAPGSMGTIKDFSFAGPGSLNFPNPNFSGPIVSFQSVGGASFTLTSIGSVGQAGNQLSITGTGFFSLPNFSNTVGVFDFTANTGAGTFSFSASNAAVPEPASLILLGAGLLVLSASLSRRTKSKRL